MMQSTNLIFKRRYAALAKLIFPQASSYIAFR